MEILIVIIIISIMLAFAISIYYIRAFEEKIRTKELQNVASKLKLEFSYENARNVIYGSYKNKTLRYSDYDYSVFLSRNKVRRSDVLYDFDNKVRIKRLDIIPANFLNKPIFPSGYIKFDSDEFNRKFYVKSEDRKFANDIIHPGMMEFLLQNGGSYSFELKEHSILLYKNGELNSQEVEHMLDTMVGFVNLLPDYLLKELKTG